MTRVLIRANGRTKRSISSRANSPVESVLAADTPEAAEEERAWSTPALADKTSLGVLMVESCNW